VKLAATHSPRDAYGTTVEVECDGVKSTRQLVAGGGFLAANERTLHFGLGSRNRIDRLTVHWPSGVVETFVGVAADQQVILIEGISPRGPIPLWPLAD
jgi:hypothetical protein